MTTDNSCDSSSRGRRCLATPPPACPLLLLSAEQPTRLSSDAPDLVGAQLAISDIIDLLNRFDTPVEVMSVMFKTPPNDMHIFTADEIERYKLNRTGTEQQPTTAAAPVLPSTAPGTGGAPTSTQITAPPSQTPPVTATASTPPTSQETQALVSPIEEFTKRPNRIAIYTGMDLFGDDISSTRVVDAAACALSCLLTKGECKAFTFNADPKIKRGPNCFLKSSAGRADGNSVTFSGRFLSAADADPSAITLGTIDPKSALFDNVDLPGGDLSRFPDRAAKTPLDCRLACIDEAQCVAFTYLKKKKECWLKGFIGTPIFGQDMVSGMKKLQTFSPAKIISLN
ncbi:hypothetical protein G6M06_18850 [Agrobacterium rhizogenes]|nr:hypothetical protein [Rhizobium rhizogenes]